MNLIKIMMTLILLFCIQGCVSLFNNDQQKIDQLELQESIQRFYSRFTERIVDGLMNDSKLMQSNRTTIIGQYLLYDSEALKIATAPYPEVNLLDMIVFIKANKRVIRRYWIPKVYGHEGIALYNGFREAEQDLDHLALKILSKEQLKGINEGIHRWLVENPQMIRVEKVRVADFSKFMKVSGTDFSFSISQIFVDTKSAVKAVDQVSLVGNRALFLAQHMPLILRLHARLGTQEMISDTISNLQSAPKITEGIEAANPLVENLTTLTTEITKLLKDYKDVRSEGRRNAKGPGFYNTLGKIDSIVENGVTLLGEANQLRPHDDGPIKKLKKEIHDLIIFSGTTLIIIAAATSLLWWGGYYICKRMLNGQSQKETL
jgi:hypothetical protein